MSTTIEFYPISVTYKTLENKPVIHIFARTTDNKRICIIDETYKPYFIVVQKKGYDLYDKVKKLDVEVEEKRHLVTDTEIIKKKIGLKEVDALKVYVNDIKAIKVISDIIKNWEGISSVNEYDILFSSRYIYDKKIIPLALTSADGEFVNSHLNVPCFSASSVKNISDDILNEPKVLAFDIETYNPDGKRIDFEKNPIIMISLYSSGYEKVLTWKRFKSENKNIEFLNGESELLDRFFKIIKEFKPDIIVGYNSDEFDFPYINYRAKKYKIDDNLGLDSTNLRVYGKNVRKSKIFGITHVDLLRFISNVIKRDKAGEYLSLNNISLEFLKDTNDDIDIKELYNAWDNDKDELNLYALHNLKDSMLTYDLFKKLYFNITELMKITSLQLFRVTRASVSELVESFILKNKDDYNIIAKNKPSKDEIASRFIESYSGGFVVEPRPGLYDDIVVFDYKSLYPSIIASHNISPSSLNCSCCKENASYVPGEKYYFCKNKKAFIPSIIEELIKRRERVKEIIKEDDDELLFAREQTLKLIANSIYGYLAYYAARWYSIESARSITAFARHYIKMTIDTAKEKGFDVIYGDTDSVFISLHGKSKDELNEFLDKVNNSLPELMELEYEGYYPKGLFVSAKEGKSGAKKKYALLKKDNTLKIKGFESVKRNYSSVAREVQKEVLEILLKEEDKVKALSYVRNMVWQVKEKKVSKDKMIISTRLSRNIESYETNAPYVAVGKRMLNLGFKVKAGTLVKYIIKDVDGRVSEKARHVSEVKDNDYDSDYYINNQIIPSVEKVFEVVGIDIVEALKKADEKEQKGLGEY